MKNGKISIIFCLDSPVFTLFSKTFPFEKYLRAFFPTGLIYIDISFFRLHGVNVMLKVEFVDALICFVAAAKKCLKYC